MPTWITRRGLIGLTLMFAPGVMLALMDSKSVSGGGVLIATIAMWVGIFMVISAFLQSRKYRRMVREEEMRRMAVAEVDRRTAVAGRT